MVRDKKSVGKVGHPPACLLGVISGFILFVLPELLRGEHAGSLFALVDASVKNLSAVHLLLLLTGGVFWGVVLRWPYSFWAAVCQVVSLPIFTVCEIVKDPKSHNLWPFEFFIYAALTLIPLIGMSAVVLVKRTMNAKRKTGDN
ncbi:MAG TPA: hypothetical protein VKW06_15550 [Candidatus Angelobacter sp.]|nr:hypothetical protein [Candidatus Angelobacter sp.]